MSFWIAFAGLVLTFVGGVGMILILLESQHCGSDAEQKSFERANRTGLVVMIIGMILFSIGDGESVTNRLLYGPKPPPAKAGASLFDKICGFASY